MNLVNNFKIVNCGTVRKIEGVEVEILSHKFHNPTCDIVTTYIREGNKKVEITYYKDINTNLDGSEIYFFKNDDTHHYYSRRYDFDKVPNKYKILVKKLREAHSKIDFDTLEKENSKNGKV